MLRIQQPESETRTNSIVSTFPLQFLSTGNTYTNLGKSINSLKTQFVHESI